MSAVLTSDDIKRIGAQIRTVRKPRMNLDQLAEAVGKRIGKRPSAAKLSRVETGVQPVPLDILPAISEILDIPAKDLRPDVAAKFEGAQ